LKTVESHFNPKLREEVFSETIPCGEPTICNPEKRATESRLKKAGQLYFGRDARGSAGDVRAFDFPGQVSSF
jgi:hypothetical protein